MLYTLFQKNLFAWSIILVTTFSYVHVIHATSILNSTDVAVELKCENDICKCVRSENFDVDTLEKQLKEYHLIDTALLACAYHQLGVINHYNDQYEKAILHYKRAIKLREAFDDGWLWKSQLNLASTFFLNNQNEQSLIYLEKSQNQEGHPRRPKDSILLFHLFASAYKEIGELENALQFAKKVTTVNAVSKRKIRAQINYVDVLVSTKDTSNLKHSILLLKSLLSKDNHSTENLVRINNILGNAYSYLNDFEKSTQYYSKALKLEEDDATKAILAGNMATVFTEQNNVELAIKYLNLSKRLNEGYFDQEFHYMYASNYENFGDYFIKINQLDSSLVSYQKALINLTDKFSEKDIQQNPNPNDKDIFIYSNPDIIRVLHLKATAAYQHYQQNKEEKYLNLANQTYQTLIDFHNKLQKDISTENSRLFQSKNIVEYLERSLEVAFTKQLKGSFDGEATFRLMEKNKATVLLQSMNEADALQFANLPDSLIEQEKELKLYISEYKRQLNDAKIYEDTITIIKELENTLFENKEKHQRLIKTLEDNYPDYYQLKYKQNQATLAAVQSRLKKSTALLAYFVGEKHIYIFSIQKNKTKLYQIKKPTNWRKQINDFVALFNPIGLDRDELHSTAQLKEFTRLSSYLFELLLKQPLNDLDENITQLQIIPDAELNYLPFDVLLYEKPDTTDNLTFGALPYLINQKAIGYVYSANLWLDNLKTEPLNEPIAYGGYASIYSSDNYADLPKPRKQVEELAKLFKGKSYIAEVASKALFLKDTNSYVITQLAMHGEVNDTLPLSSHLVFTPNDSSNFKLYAADLYNKKLHTKLAVLNACNTGTGQLQKGEGVMSLSRAFTYAGCPSLVMSLWSIPDVSSAEVLDDFFVNLKNGATKDVALQHAKINFLATSEKTHPVYWAGLVAVGSLEALEFNVHSEISNWFYYVLTTLVLLTGLGVYKKKMNDQ